MEKMVNFVLCIFYHNLIKKNKCQCPGVISALAWTEAEGEITKSRGWSRKGGPGEGHKSQGVQGERAGEGGVQAVWGRCRWTEQWSEAEEQGRGRLQRWEGLVTKGALIGHGKLSERQWKATGGF